jgi:hypothetical protein
LFDGLRDANPSAEGTAEIADAIVTRSLSPGNTVR